MRLSAGESSESMPKKPAEKSKQGDTAESDADPVNHPAHYTAGGIECIDAIESALTADEFRGFIKGTVLAYVWRERHKGGDEDVAKAAWYLARLREVEAQAEGK